MMYQYINEDIIAMLYYIGFNSKDGKVYVYENMDIVYIIQIYSSINIDLYKTVDGIHEAYHYAFGLGLLDFLKEEFKYVIRNKKICKIIDCYEANSN
jgi:hypothetical protein